MTRSVEFVVSCVYAQVTRAVGAQLSIPDADAALLFGENRIIYLDSVDPPNAANTALKQADLDTDVTLAADSDSRIPSQKAVKAYADAISLGPAGVASVNGRSGAVVLGSADVDLSGATIAAAPSNQTADGLIVNLTYGEAITLGAALYYKNDGKVYNANATDTSKIPCMGIALATASSGSHPVLLFGVYRDDTNLNFSTVGGLVYPDTSNGALTQTAPSGSDQVIQPVGIALAQRRILFAPALMFLTHT